MGNSEPYDYTYCHTLTKVSLLIEGSPPLEFAPLSFLKINNLGTNVPIQLFPLSCIIPASLINQLVTCQGPQKCHLGNHR